MNLQERKEELIKKIYEIEDEGAIQMLEESLVEYSHSGVVVDITEELSEEQLKDLMELLDEPSDKNTVSEEEFKKLFSRWSSK